MKRVKHFGLIGVLTIGLLSGVATMLHVIMLTGDHHLSFVTPTIP